MILSIVFHFLKTVFSRVIKVIAWLLVALSLWVPLLYTVVFVVVCGLTHKSLTEYSTWYFAGLAVSFIGSFIISTFLYERRLAQKKQQSTGSWDNLQKVKEKEPTSKIKKREDEINAAATVVQPIENQPNNIDTAAKHNFISYANQPNMDPETNFSPENQGVDYGQGGFSPPLNQGYSQDNIGYGENYSNFEQKNYQPYPPINEQVFTPPSSQSLGSNEKPMVFATRSDPNVLIYEYSNRLEFYKKTLNGLILIKTQYKQSSF